ncbi:MAG: cereblon family protein [Verrucomicrobiota bacterium]|nr:cereblon family protein [Limisphaera sp.]MDW8380934.1 cereblon family protein [Verrucomicrobiota bacterium]
MEQGFVGERQASLDAAQVSAGPYADLKWYCVRCLREVAREADRLVHQGPPELEFRNPEGQRFRILLFRDCPGGRAVGTPSDLHSWFPGYAWCYCLCRGCGMQLGWWYEATGRFAGLIRGRILSALQWYN